MGVAGGPIIRLCNEENPFDGRKHVDSTPRESSPPHFRVGLGPCFHDVRKQTQHAKLGGRRRRALDSTGRASPGLSGDRIGRRG
jgi:hypothetical protein